MTHITDGQHVSLHCENHPELHWHCKIIAVSRNGRYNGMRNIFQAQDYECPCPGASLIIDEEELPTLEAYYNQN